MVRKVAMKYIFSDCLTMPAYVDIMAMGLIFSLFNFTSARQVPFGIPLHRLTSVLFIFADSMRCRFMVDGFPMLMGIV